MNLDFQRWLEGGPKTVASVVQGDCKVSSDPDLVFSTILGSCVAVCLYDRAAQVGGMNHYLLPGQDYSGGPNLKYGVYAMELLVNALLKAGGRRHALRAKVFGGACLTDTLNDVGSDNADIAIEFLSTEGFRIDAQDLRGTHARRVHFHPTSGRARVVQIPKEVEETLAEAPEMPRGAGSGTVEFFD